MKVSVAALCVVLGVSSVECFVSSPSMTSAAFGAARSVVQLEAKRDNKSGSVGAAVGAAAVGWALASQVAFASIVSPISGKQSAIQECCRHVYVPTRKSLLVLTYGNQS